MSGQSLKFSFSRQEYVNQVKPYKKIYIYAVSRTVIEKVIERLDLKAEITRKIEDADVVIAHKAYSKGGNKILSTANDYRLPIYYIRSNSMSQIQKVVKEALHITDSEIAVEGYCDEAEKALDETQEAIKKVIETGTDVELKAQNQQIRKLQHELIDQHNLNSSSVGDGDDRHIIIYGNKNSEN